MAATIERNRGFQGASRRGAVGFARRALSLVAVLGFGAGVGLGAGVALGGGPRAAILDGLGVVYAEPTYDSTKVAYFDLYRCFKESVRTSAKVEELEVGSVAVNERLAAIQDEMKKLETDRAIMTPGSDKHFDLSKKMDALRAEVEFTKGYKEQLYLQEFFEFRTKHWEEIRREVARFSEEQGLDLVVLKSTPRREEGDSEESWEIVFHGSPRYDITDAIIARINRDQ